jgi:hypothetical protein
MTDTMRAAPEKLRAAAVLVADVMAMLNVGVHQCEGCGRLEPNDVVEHKAYLALLQSRQKLLDWADTLYLPAAERETSPAGRRAQARRERGR